VIADQSNVQLGWDNVNQKSFEPSDIAPTWIHYDVRCYEAQYLEDRFFCKTLEALDHLQTSRGLSRKLRRRRPRILR
jgi:hypothetical protein